MYGYEKLKPFDLASMLTWIWIFQMTYLVGSVPKVIGGFDLDPAKQLGGVPQWNMSIKMMFAAVLHEWQCLYRLETVFPFTRTMALTFSMDMQWMETPFATMYSFDGPLQRESLYLGKYVRSPS